MKRKQPEISASQTPERPVLPPAAEKALRTETRKLISEYVNLLAPDSDFARDPDLLEFAAKILNQDLLASGIPLARKNVRAFVEKRLFEMRDCRQKPAKKPVKRRWIQYQTGALTSATH